MYLSLLLKTFCIYLAQHLFTMIPTPELCVKGVLQKVWYVGSFLCVKYAESVCLVSVSPTKSIFFSLKSSITCLYLVVFLRFCSLCVAIVKVLPVTILFVILSVTLIGFMRFV